MVQFLQGMIKKGIIMKFKLFKEIFDLNPSEVENFIIDKIKSEYNFDTKEKEEQWWKDFNLKINWYPTHNQFYVYTEPNLKYENKEIEIPEIVNEQFPYFKKWNTHYIFKDRDISLDEYLWHTFDHYHFNFREIYALITGKTEIWSVCTNFINDDLELSYDGIYNKEYVTVIKTKAGEWFFQKWEKGETLIDEDGEEYIDNIEKRLPLQKELLDYVITLDPEEVKLR